MTEKKIDFDYVVKSEYFGYMQSFALETLYQAFKDRMKKEQDARPSLETETKELLREFGDKYIDTCGSFSPPKEVLQNKLVEQYFKDVMKIFDPMLVEEITQKGGAIELENNKPLRAVYSGKNTVKISAINENFEVVEKEINIG